MAFPINPNDGDTYIAASGIKYEYSASEDSWTMVAAQSITGETGAQGLQGETGAQGETGLQGSEGSQGVTGVQGVQGTQGETGIQGIQGAEGDQGETGLQGETGFGTQGETGIQGTTGVQYVDGSVNVIFDGGGSDLFTGIKTDIRVPFNLEIQSWAMTSRESGSILIGVWRDSYANFPPDSSDAMHSGATGPNISAGIKNQDTDVTDWSTTTASAGDWLRFNVDSVTGIQLATVALNYTIT